MSGNVQKKHINNAATAKSHYVKNVNPEIYRRDWHFAIQEARQLIISALRASQYFYDIETCLARSGEHSLVLRHILAPPVSQDQFLLLCPAWSKSKEKTGKGLSENAAREVAHVIYEWIDPRLVIWLGQQRPPSRGEVKFLLNHISPIIAKQRMETARRNRIALEQEIDVVEFLKSLGWQLVTRKTIDRAGVVQPHQFMHKTRCATGATTTEEVDIACGLPQTTIVAMECKVSNDATNSVKRVNDVIKKANAWQNHWGAFVKTAVMLSGVIQPRDVQRLEDNGIVIFWSHMRDEFRKWLEAQFKGRA